MHPRVAAFRHALRGLRTLLATQAHARFHLAATAAVVALAAHWRLAGREWSLLVVAIALVWATEAMNTALEFLADEVTLATRPRIRQAKDVAAGAVLLASLAAAVIGALVFAPHLTGGH